MAMVMTFDDNNDKDNVDYDVGYDVVLSCSCSW